MSFEVMPGRPNAFFRAGLAGDVLYRRSGSMALALLFMFFTSARSKAIFPSMLQENSVHIAGNSLLFVSILKWSLATLLLLVPHAFFAGAFVDRSAKRMGGFAFSLPLFLLLLLWARAWHPRFWYLEAPVEGVLLVVSSGVAAIL